MRANPAEWDGVSYQSHRPQSGKAQRCVKFVVCPLCKAKRGELCMGSRGRHWETHYVRRYAFHVLKRLWQGLKGPAWKVQAIKEAGGPMPRKVRGQNPWL